MSKTTKTALITGSGKNLGRACATELAAAGFNIVINGSSDRAACERVASEVHNAGTEAMIVMADVGDSLAVSRMADAALKKYGVIDVLVNNAAIRPATGFLDMTDADLDHVMNVNCYAAVRLSRRFLPGMIERGWGRIINFSGMNAQQGTGGRPQVTMSKHASWGLSKALAREFGPAGVTVNIISPGTFPGEGEEVTSSERFQKLLKQNPAGRLGTSDDIAAMVGLLCSDRGGFINGQLLQVNGGVVG